MTQPLILPAPATTSPRPALSEPLDEQDAGLSWSRPITNPRRNALIASAAEKLAKTARRIAAMQARLDLLLAQPAANPPS